MDFAPEKSNKSDIGLDFL